MGYQSRVVSPLSCPHAYISIRTRNELWRDVQELVVGAAEAYANANGWRDFQNIQDVE